MKKSRPIFLTAVLVVMILSLSAESAHSKIEADARSEASNFLEHVAGFNIKDVNVISFNVSTPEMLGSKKPQTVINGLFSYDSVNYTLAIILVEGKVWYYQINPLSAIPKNAQISENSCLGVAGSAIQGCQAYFNANHLSGFVEMLPTTLETREVVVDSGDKMLNISHTVDSANQLEYAKFRWFKKVDGYTIPQMSTTITISKMGLMCSFVDNLGLYEVTTSQVTVSKEEAIAIAMPYFEDNAIDSDAVEIVEATFEYAADTSSLRGDRLTVYPQWKIFAGLDRGNENSARLYSVLLWADTGEVYNHSAQGYFDNDSEQPTSTSQMSLAIVTVAILGSFCGAILLLRRRSKKIRKNQPNTVHRICSLIAIIILMCALYIPLSHADSAMILGSRHDVNNPLYPNEQQTNQATCNWIGLASAYQAGYNVLYWYGSSTTAANAYTAARGNDDSNSYTFTIGHGGPYTVWHYWWGQWHPHNYMAFLADDGSHICDHFIHLNSVGHDGNRLVFMWNCHQAEDAMGSWINYPCGTQEHGMPLAWCHTTDLSGDGYNNPNYWINPSQVFIGFTGIAPYLTNNKYGFEHGKVFLYHFFWAALEMELSVHDSLDLASQALWGVNYGDSWYKNGFNLQYYDWQLGVRTLYGKMEVYGNSIHYL
jgi:hypothetical protein